MIDKSTLQGITAREANWLFHHFRVNIPPVLFHEIIGDLHKSNPKRLSTDSGAGDVRMLASKIGGHSVDLNAVAEDLIVLEMKGFRLVLDGRPVLGNAERIKDPRGGFGIYVDQTPMQQVMERWRAGDFKGMETAFAKRWRNDLKTINLERIIALTKDIRVKSCNSAESVMELVEAVLDKPGENYVNLKRLMDNVDVPLKHQRRVIDRWKAKKRPPSSDFAPYSAYVAKLEWFFFVAVAHHVISTRSSNQIDMEYFKYLPFTKVFTSGDNLHRDLFPVFAREDQVFVSKDDLKQALAELADHYDAMSEEQKSKGSFTYADYPPVTMDNTITRAYDKILPGWREGANVPPPPLDADAERKILESFRPVMDAIKRRTGTKNLVLLGHRPFRPEEDFPFTAISIPRKK